MALQLTINSNNPTVAGVYTGANDAAIISQINPILANFTSAQAATANDCVNILTIYGHVAFLNVV